MSSVVQASLFFVLLMSMVAGCKTNRNDLNVIKPACVDGGTPSWIVETIEGFKTSDTKASVEQYRYKGQYVFMINSCVGCADGMTIVYNCDGEEICKFGGFAGFNTCPDFEKEATGRKMIWQN